MKNITKKILVWRYDVCRDIYEAECACT